MKFIRRQHAEEGVTDISPINMIDMMCILVIFFVVTSSSVKDLKLELERPGAASAVKASSKAIRVHIDRHGDLYLEGAPVRSWMLQSKVAGLLKDDPQSEVLIVADRLLPTEKLVEAVDQCKLAGAKTVGVSTDEEAS